MFSEIEWTEGRRCLFSKTLFFGADMARCITPIAASPTRVGSSLADAVCCDGFVQRDCKTNRQTGTESQVKATCFAAPSAEG